MKLLLLRVAVGDGAALAARERMSRPSRLTFTGVVVAFIVFVTAGYLIPISWTGFSGNNLWDWLTLVVLAVAVVTIGAWAGYSRQIRSRHIAVFSALGAARLVTVIGGTATPGNGPGTGQHPLGLVAAPAGSSRHNGPHSCGSSLGVR